jgi:hypothetical protein
MTGYSNIAVYYNTLFSLVQHHKYTLTEVNEMYPFERDLFVELIVKYLKEVEEQKKNNGQSW